MKIYKFLDKTGQKCDAENSQNLEAIHYNFLHSKLKCNLPWARFKLDTQIDCSTIDQMKEYFNVAREIDEYLSGNLIPNCQLINWTPESIHTDLNQGQCEYEGECDFRGSSFMLFIMDGLSNYVSTVV